MPVVLGMPWVAERAASTVQLVLGCAVVSVLGCVTGAGRQLLRH